MYTLREWQQLKIPREALIVQASTIDGNDGWTQSPIGMGYQYLFQRGNENACRFGDHKNTVLCAIHPTSDGRRRRYSPVNRSSIVNNLKRNGIENKYLEPADYFTSLPKYKFVISPEGNGIDTHRHYESLMAGCIPIIEDNPMVREKYGNVPILWTYDYSEITEDYLQKKYAEMLDKKWDFSRIFIYNWHPNEQHLIRQRGNYWCEKLTGIEWYS